MAHFKKIGETIVPAVAATGLVLIGIVEGEHHDDVLETETNGQIEAPQVAAVTSGSHSSLGENFGRFRW